jgi:hypothetical protein
MGNESLLSGVSELKAPQSLADKAIDENADWWEIEKCPVTEDNR